MLVEDQSEVLAFLNVPEHFPGAPPVTRIDTHTSAVFLAGAHAYKLKRAVRYDYLDYSTIERRRIACEAEWCLNRRTAPGLYLSVMPITRADDGLSLGGTGLPVDWLVVMRRFEQEQLFDRLAQARALTRETVVRLADTVAAFHASAAPRRDVAGAQAIRDVIDGNTSALHAAGAALDQQIVTQLDQRLHVLVARNEQILDGRRERGMVRECHGDLHLRNVVMLDGTPTLFDGIEFNTAFSCIDVMYDFAFLVMDLLARGLASDANALFNRYLSRTSDFEGLRLLPLFLACRAAVRAKTSLAAADLSSDPAAIGELRRRAADYLRLAEHVSRLMPVRLIAIGGFSGSGKSTLAARLAPSLGAAPGAVVLRTDVVRKLMFAQGGAQTYRSEARHSVYTEIRREAVRALDAGFVVIVDAVFGDAVERRAIEALAAAQGVTFAGLWLEANVDTLERRIRDRQDDASDATVDVLFRQMRESGLVMSWRRIDASDDAELTAREALSALGHEVVA
jgi:aminoglycoside phosphotransferase family enzyme/predicted kinase